MITFIKQIVRSFNIAREFDNQMAMMDSMRGSKKKHKIKVTKEQMNILTVCASIGIKDTKDLSESMN